jgi:alkylhydroperoxidase family enzyme
MPRIDLPSGDLPETARLFSLQPVLGKAIGALSHAIYGQTTVDLRVREAVRMRIAHMNHCLLCIGFRFPEQDEQFTASGIDESFYAAIPDWRASTLFSEREQWAIEYAERFVQNHLSLDAAFMSGLSEHFKAEELFALTAIIAGLMANGRILQVLDVEQQACGI